MQKCIHLRRGQKMALYITFKLQRWKKNKWNHQNMLKTKSESGKVFIKMLGKKCNRKHTRQDGYQSGLHICITVLKFGV